MPKPSSTLADSLTAKYRSLESTRAKVERIANSRQLGKRDVERMYEGLFLSAHGFFEAFIENLFVGLLVKNAGYKSSLANITPRIEVRSHKVARELLTKTAQRKYINWLPYQRTSELAKIYFSGGRPFCTLTQQQKDLIFRFHTIRNAIAHRSSHSTKKFRVVVLQSVPLPSSERNPAGFLRGLFRRSPDQTRFENITAEIIYIARILAR